jgi:hypothetical protein
MKSCAQIRRRAKILPAQRNPKQFTAAGLLFAVVLLTLNCLQVKAQAVESATKPSFPISSKWSRSLQKYTGINLITEIAAARIAALCIKAKLGGHVKVSVHVYSFTDLLSGKVKSVAVKLSGSSYRGVPLGNVTLASTNPVWYHPFKSRKLQAGLQLPFLAQLDGSVNNTCVAALLNGNAPLISKAGKLQLPGMGEQQLVFIKPTAAIENGKVCIKSTVVTAGASPDTGVDLIVTGVPYLDGSKIMLKDLCVTSADIIDPVTFSSFVEGVTNPLYNLARLDRRDHAFRLDTLTVEGSKVKYAGKLLVAPTAVATTTTVATSPAGAPR